MKIIQLGLVAGLLSTVAIAETSTLPFDSEAGCKQGPLAQFGQYLGDWKIEDSGLSQETDEWEPGQGALDIYLLGLSKELQDSHISLPGKTPLVRLLRSTVRQCRIRLVKLRSIRQMTMAGTGSWNSRLMVVTLGRKFIESRQPSTFPELVHDS